MKAILVGLESRYNDRNNMMATSTNAQNIQQSI